MNEKVIHLRKQTDAQAFLREIDSALALGNVTDLIVMVRYKDSSVEHSWFGIESSLRCLGMATYMTGRINKYIEGENDH